MTDDDRVRVQNARERALAKAAEFFGNPTVIEQMMKMEQAQEGDGAGAACPRPDHEEIGRAHEQAGWITKADYLEMMRIIDAFRAGGAVSDSDHDWMLSLLAGSGEAIIRTRVLALLGEMVKRDGATPERAALIEAAIEPWRTGSEDLDIISWAHVRKALDDRAAGASA